MGMEITSLTPAVLSVASGRSSADLAAPQAATAENPVQDALPVSSIRTLYAQLFAKQDLANDEARGLRIAMQSFAAADAGLSSLNKAIEAIVKIYPPYPQYHPIRVDLLNQIVGLRKVVEQLTVPLVAGLNTQDVAPQNSSGTGLTLGQLLVGQPATGPESTNAQLSDFMVGVQAAQQRLAGVKQALWNDVTGGLDLGSEHQISQDLAESKNYLEQTGITISVDGSRLRLVN